MPSQNYELLISMLREGRANRGPMTLDDERREADRYADLFPGAPGIAEEVHPAGLLLTPADARDDLAVVYIHGGGFRTGSARNARQVGARQPGWNRTVRSPPTSSTSMSSSRWAPTAPSSGCCGSTEEEDEFM
ncbi:hypothetical protein [Streptosporangium amethystogenes]|uniref:hypothetical protein n=1 Tax=Streptosporangium amethystogenes TaxID=2002 RepID=UPI0012F95DD6|nr:hypothetical protein [Streptosporangium amethystogenes]